MRLRSVAVRTLRVASVAIVALLVLVFALVQIPQRVLRHRAERLLADFHSIQLHESTAQDAERIAKRWGAFTHTQGNCTAADCEYSIALDDMTHRIMPHIYGRWLPVFLIRKLYWLFQHMGATPARFDITFSVLDGRIVRSSAVYTLYTPVNFNENFDIADGYPIGFIARSHPTLRSAMGGDMELAGHPEYKIGRPGGCDNCELGFISYTPYISQSELNRLTDFRFECLTRFHHCTELSELLPMAAAWHLYDDENLTLESPHDCRESPVSRTREAASVYEIEVLDSRAATEVDSVRVLRTLKGSAISAGAKTTLFPFIAPVGRYEYRLSEHALPGHRYFIYLDPDVPDKAGTLAPNWCGVVEVTPQSSALTERGIAESTTQTEAELHPEWW